MSTGLLNRSCSINGSYEGSKDTGPHFWCKVTHHLRRGLSTSKIETHVATLMYENQGSHGPFWNIVYLKRPMHHKHRPREKASMEGGKLGYNFNITSLSSFPGPNLGDSPRRSVVRTKNHTRLQLSAYMSLLCWPSIHSFHKNFFRITAMHLFDSSHEEQSSTMLREDAPKTICRCSEQKQVGLKKI